MPKRSEFSQCLQNRLRQFPLAVNSFGIQGYKGSFESFKEIQRQADSSRGMPIEVKRSHRTSASNNPQESQNRKPDHERSQQPPQILETHPVLSCATLHSRRYYSAGTTFHPCNLTTIVCRLCRRIGLAVPSYVEVTYPTGGRMVRCDSVWTSLHGAVRCESSLVADVGRGNAPCAMSSSSTDFVLPSARREQTFARRMRRCWAPGSSAK